MNRLALSGVIITIFILLLGSTSCSTRLFSSFHARKAEKEMAGRERSSRHYGESKAAKKAKKQQEKRQKKLKSDYYKSVKKSRERTIEIQTPEVQKRMKEDIVKMGERDKARKKRSGIATRKGAKKYN